MKGSRRVEYYNKIKETTYAFNVSSHVRANVFYKVHSTFFTFYFIITFDAALVMMVVVVAV